MTAPPPQVWGRPRMPPAVVGAAVLCFGGIVIASWALTGSTGYVLEPEDGVTRAEATRWTLVFAAAMALLLVGAAGIQARRPWAWWLCAELAALGALAGAYGTRAFVDAMAAQMAGTTVGANIGLGLFVVAPLSGVACIVLLVAFCRSRARGWFGVQASVL